jgi:hypothetical protein
MARDGGLGEGFGRHQRDNNWQLLHGSSSFVSILKNGHV